MAEKSVAGLKQAEITIIEERLSTPFGTLSIDIAGSLSNRFDSCNAEISKVESELIYAESIKDVDARRKKIADIMNRLKSAKEDRKTKIWAWHPKVLAYIKEVYGEPIKDNNGTVLSYGERIEIMKNKNLKKIW